MESTTPAGRTPYTRAEPEVRRSVHQRPPKDKRRSERAFYDRTGRDMQQNDNPEEEGSTSTRQVS